jgi:cytochrome c553
MKDAPLRIQTLAMAILLAVTAIPQTYAAAPDDGAALAESCAACHGTDTNRAEGFENLLGENHYQDLIEMKYRSNPESIMDWVARTYTDQQLSDISQYFRAHGKKSGGN